MCRTHASVPIGVEECRREVGTAGRPTRALPVHDRDVRPGGRIVSERRSGEHRPGEGASAKDRGVSPVLNRDVRVRSGHLGIGEDARVRGDHDAVRTGALHRSDDRSRRIGDLGGRHFGDRSERRDHRIGSHQRRLHRVGVRGRTLQDLHRIGEPLLRRVPHERDHVVTALDRLRHDQPARLPGSPEHDDLHGRSLAQPHGTLRPWRRARPSRRSRPPSRVAPARRAHRGRRSCARTPRRARSPCTDRRCARPTT